VASTVPRPTFAVSSDFSEVGYFGRTRLAKPEKKAGKGITNKTEPTAKRFARQFGAGRLQAAFNLAS
jgi:hypothetical protein